MVCVARSEGPLQDLAKEITDAGGSAEARVCDISDPEALGGLVDSVASERERLDILVLSLIHI